MTRRRSVVSVSLPVADYFQRNLLRPVCFVTFLTSKKPPAGLLGKAVLPGSVGESF